MTRELLRQALDALECPGCALGIGHRCGKCDSDVDDNSVVREAIRTYLAQPQGEPVAWIDSHPHPWSHTLGTQQSLRWSADECTEATPLYLHPAHTEADVQEILDASYREAGALEPAIRRVLGVPA